MKSSEIIKANYGKISESMFERLRTVYECGGRIQYAIYVWEDGELEIMQQAHGDSSWLEAKESETRALVYVGTVKAPNFDPWAVTDEPKPEDDAAREEAEAEIINWVMDGAEQYVDAIIEERIEELEREDD